MKKILKIVAIICISLFILLAAALAVLRWMFPDARLKQMALNYVKNNFNREISFDKVSFNLHGFTLKNFALSEATTFEQGTFIKADKIQTTLAWGPLLRKKVKIKTIRIDGLDVVIQQNKDGSFNFDDLTSSEKEEEKTTSNTENEGLGFSLTARRFIANNCSFTYKDLTSGTTTGVDKINFDIQDFDLANPFTAVITFTTQIKQKHAADIILPAELDLTVFLADLNMPQAYVSINKATASYKTVQLALNGKLEDFNNPVFSVEGTITGVNNTVFSDILPNLPNFTLPTITLALDVNSNLDESSAQIERAEIRLQDSHISTSGPITWGGKQPTYNLSGKVDINIEQAVQMTDTVDVRPTGTISGPFKATDKKDYQDVNGTLQLKNVSLIYDPFTLSKANGTIRINSLQNISSDNLTGLLNGEKLNVSFSYKEMKDIPTITLKGQLDKLHLTSFSGSENNSAEPEQTQENAPESGETSSEPETFMNLKIDLQIGEITIPYFRTNGLTLNADLTRFSTAMTKTGGTASFSLEPGAITDMDTLLKGNKIVRFILLPLGIINSVAKKLNISLFEATSNARKGEIAFSSGEGEYTFTNGLMTIDHTSFISDLTNLKGTGSINFPANTLDMKVSASLLTKQTPIVIKIGGTLDNPSGKLDVLNTVTSVVGGLLNYKTTKGLATGTVKTAGNVAKGTVKTAGNVATGAAKTTGKAAGTVVKTGTDAIGETVKAIGGLFKKKKDDSEESAQSQ